MRVTPSTGWAVVNTFFPSTVASLGVIPLHVSLGAVRLTHARPVILNSFTL
jgi:hypothetical protein